MSEQLPIKKENLQASGLDFHRNDEGGWISNYTVRVLLNEPNTGESRSFDVQYKPAELSHIFGFVITEVQGNTVVYTTRANYYDMGYSPRDIKLLITTSIEYVKDKMGEITQADHESFKGYLEIIPD